MLGSFPAWRAATVLVYRQVSRSKCPFSQAPTTLVHQMHCWRPSRSLSLLDRSAGRVASRQSIARLRFSIFVIRQVRHLVWWIFLSSESPDETSRAKCYSFQPLSSLEPSWVLSWNCAAFTWQVRSCFLHHQSLRVATEATLIFFPRLRSYPLLQSLCRTVRTNYFFPTQIYSCSFLETFIVICYNKLLITKTKSI